MASEMRFAELRKMLESNGWTLDRISGSHHVFTKPGQRSLPISVHRGKVKPGYVRQIQKIIESN